MSDSIANGYGCRPCKQVQLNVTDAIIHFIGDGSALSHLNASNVDFGTLSTSVFPASGVTAGTYGSSSNVSQVTIDTYGRVTSATNVAVTSSQWTGAPGSPIYYIPGVGIGSSIPATANLQVTGNVYVSNALTTSNVNITDTLDVVGSMTANAANATFFFDTFTIPYINTQELNVASNIVLTGNLSAPLANITTLNVNYLTVDSAVVYGTSTLNVYGVSNLSTATMVGSTGQTTLNVTGNIYASNAITTTNVFASNVTASGFLEADSTWMLGVSGTTQRTFRSGRVTGLSGVTDTVQGTATVTFGYTAASTNYRVIATVDGLTSAFPFAVAVSNKTTTTFNVRVLKINSTGASTVAVDWLLIE